MADEGVRRRPAAVAAAARERAAGRGNAGQQVSVRASPGPRGPTGAAGWRRARAASSSTERQRLWRRRGLGMARREVRRGLSRRSSTG
jgi:hypothetical protein